MDNDFWLMLFIYFIIALCIPTWLEGLLRALKY
jgi:hypothetical protein